MEICAKRRNIRATIGEKSNPPTGGIIRLNGSKKISAAAAIVLHGFLYQFMDGIHVRKILTIKNHPYISNNRFTILAISNFYFLLLHCFVQALEPFIVNAQSHSFRSAGIRSMSLNKRFFNL